MMLKGNPNIERPLTMKQQAFAQAYVDLLAQGKENGTEAARIAKYKGNDATLAAVAYENLRKPQILARIEELKKERVRPLRGHIMSSHDVLVGMTRIAEGSPLISSTTKAE